MSHILSPIRLKQLQGLYDLAFEKAVNYRGEEEDEDLEIASLVHQTAEQVFDTACSPGLACHYSEKKTFKSHKGGIWRLLPLDHHEIVSLSYDGTAKIWNVEKREMEQPHTLQHIKGKRYHNAVFCAVKSDETLITGDEEGFINFWNVADRKPLGSLWEEKPHIMGFYSMAILEGNILATGACEQRKIALNPYDIKLWELNSVEDLDSETPAVRLKKPLKGHRGGISSLVTVGGDRLVSSSHDKTIRIWDSLNSTSLKVLKGHRNTVYSVALLGNNTLVSASKDTTVRLWDMERYQEIGQLIDGQYAHKEYVYQATPFQDHLVLTVSRDNLVKLWDVRQRSLVRSFATGAICAYCVTSVGDYIAAGTYNHEDKKNRTGDLVLWHLRK